MLRFGRSGKRHRESSSRGRLRVARLGAGLPLQTLPEMRVEGLSSYCWRGCGTARPDPRALHALDPACRSGDTPSPTPSSADQHPRLHGFR